MKTKKNALKFHVKQPVVMIELDASALLMLGPYKGELYVIGPDNATAKFVLQLQRDHPTLVQGTKADPKITEVTVSSSGRVKLTLYPGELGLHKETDATLKLSSFTGDLDGSKTEVYFLNSVEPQKLNRPVKFKKDGIEVILIAKQLSDTQSYSGNLKPEFCT